MTNSEAIDLLDNLLGVIEDNHGSDYDKAIHMAIDALKGQQWIPCSERLPEADVLCCDIRGEMIIGYPYQDDESNTGYSAVSDDVYMIDCIAWMEKPEPYKEGES